MKLALLLKAPHLAPASADILEGGLGPCDRAALQTAIDLAGEAGTVTALTAGADGDDCCLRAALRAGAHRAVRITSPVLAESAVPTLSVVLATAIRQLGFDLILAGHRSTDWGRGVVGPAVAHRLDIPHLTSVIAVRPASAAGAIEADFLGEEKISTLELALPALLALRAAPCRPLAVRDTTPEIDLWSLDDLHLKLDEGAAGHPTAEPAPAQRATLLELPALLLRLKNAGLLR